MSAEDPTYSFLSWLRTGIANSITTVSGATRATIEVELTATGTGPGGAVQQTIPREVGLYGPGDIVGIDKKAIVKVEPRHWTVGFEPNYLPYVEFYDEDFPWRYTPAAPASPERLSPWLALVALTEDEFKDGKNMQGRPLPFIELTAAADLSKVFPPAAQLWAWAHVHVNEDVPEASLEAALEANPDRAYSRILCPRRLEPDTTYHAFLIPAFEIGRLAGLGLVVEGAATVSAWAPGRSQIPNHYPYYHRFRFRTGALGDFEQLVKLLQPQPVDKRVGVRDMDVNHPGSGLPAIDLPDALAGVLKLGGALRVPLDSLTGADQNEVLAYDQWDETPHPYPHPFQEALAARLNLADEYQQQAPAGDPVVTSPLYGRWHALARRVEPDNTSDPTSRNWLHELNLDPRFRVAAGLGTRVIQKGQEDYMTAAWEQVGEVIAANNQLRLAQVAKSVSTCLYDKHIASLATTDAFLLTAPVHRRVLSAGLTVHKRVADSVVPSAVTSAQFRRLTRPGATIMKRLGLSSAASAIVEAINAGTMPAAPAKPRPDGAGTLADVAGHLDAANVPKPQIETLDERQTPKDIEEIEPSLEYPGGPDARKAFGQALIDVYTYTSVEFKVPEKSPLDLGGVVASTLEALDPATSIPKRTQQTVQLPAWVQADMVETFAPVMAYPVFDLPMYEPLSELSTELFLPQIHLIPQNSLTLLETNQKFVEAYMVGLNHEMGRELLWREYPCDQRGSYFRQFWDAGSVLPDAAEEAEREALRDIPKIHQWSKLSELGEHNHREAGGDAAQIVLVVRGELLKRYPTAVLYAQKAVWHQKPGGAYERRLDPAPGAVRVPLFEAKVDPDIYFLGFDLTAADAAGDPDPLQGDAGWFFVIQERPGEPRFGLDEAEGSPPPPQTWNDLAWAHLGTPSGASIDLSQTSIALGNPGGEDAQASWDANTNSAELAYILYQVPVLVAVHASRMLP
ncbi:hypothetical protein OV203_05980 [Nannocystis sp. ILAH1]|uniref:hypothetical protein n=1 Tax=Nannocystis sp. ILAH1 TaxID=2996789 RepID=UPI002271A582|nr:hypothetical protein [Nannocystis sp. ILAH1]MCY0986659.1 hypothetical protein [Nannocystis sp. ILAH1]